MLNISATVCALVAFLLTTVYYVHMFQLNSYKSAFQLSFYKNNAAKLALRSAFAILALVASFFGKAGLIAMSVLLLLCAAVNIPKKAKKPLKFTARVNRLIFTCTLVFALFAALFLLLYSKSTLFAALLPACVLLCFAIVLFANLVNRPAELLVRRYYINDAKKKISSLKNLTVIAITGSYGKTSTKFYLEKLLGAKYNCLMTPESYNTTMGVVKTVREMLSPVHDIFICEMGARSKGEISEICEIVSPYHSMITSIGPCHLESFKSMENIVNTKFEAADAVVGRGFCFLNADCEEILNKKHAANAVYYGIKNKDAHFYAENIKVSSSGTSFELCFDGKRVPFSTKLLGEHNCANLVGALAVAITLGVPAERLILPVKTLSGAPHRLALVQGTGFTIIDDSFNSNPAGTRAALSVLSSFEDCEKILITPGMVELGSAQDKENFAFGENAASVCDTILLVGKKQTESVCEGIKSKSFAGNLKIFENVLDAINFAKTYPCQKHRAILLENDLPDNF